MCPYPLHLALARMPTLWRELYRNARLSLEMAPSAGAETRRCPGKGGLPVLRRPQQVHGKVHLKVKSRVAPAPRNEPMADAHLCTAGHSFARRCRSACPQARAGPDSPPEGGGIFENEAGRSGHCGGHQTAPDMVESPQPLESSNRVAVIDHHRRAASYTLPSTNPMPPPPAW